MALDVSWFIYSPPTPVIEICCSYQETWHGKQPMKSDAEGPQEKQEWKKHPMQSDQYTSGY